jgi:hypothetical protein
MTPRGLDHVVHAARDLDAAAEAYSRLGFTVGARNRHPWGTHNRIVQVPGFFVEILTVAEPERLAADGLARQFGAFNKAFLERGEGLSFLIVESADARRDAESFRAAGIAASDALTFRREGRRPDGSAVEIGFSLAFARDPQALDSGFAACQQHNPDAFWSPAQQRHANTAVRIAGVVLVAENPSDHHVFLSALTGERDLRATSSGLSLKTPRGEIQVMDRAAFLAHFGVEPPDIGRGARLAALRFAVADLAAAIAAMQKGKVEGQMRMGRLIVGPEWAKGATLVFEPAARQEC